VKPDNTSGTCHELDENTDPIQREFYEFYRMPRGEYTPESSSPELTTHPTLSSNTKFMNFYPFNDIETISPRPMLSYKRAAEPKELHYVKGAGHVDLYDNTKGLAPFDKLESFFKEHLQ